MQYPYRPLKDDLNIGNIENIEFVTFRAEIDGLGDQWLGEELAQRAMCRYVAPVRCDLRPKGAETKWNRTGDGDEWQLR